MSKEKIAVKDCGHRGFAQERIPGKGYRASCPECGIDTYVHYASAGVAMQAFEVKVAEAIRRERA